MVILLNIENTPRRNQEDTRTMRRKKERNNEISSQDQNSLCERSCHHCKRDRSQEKQNLKESRIQE
jgi:hypothetical protein